MGFGIAAILWAAPGLAQTISGGQAPQADGSIRSSDLGGYGSATSQYLQQKSLNNLTDQQTGSATVGKRVRSRQALASELTVGAVINDKSGAAIGTIEKVDPDGIVVATKTGKVKVPAEAFGHNKAGLLLDTSKADFDQIVAKANTTPAG
jgi:preprotein translocase subunit YajC